MTIPKLRDKNVGFSDMKILGVSKIPNIRNENPLYPEMEIQWGAPYFVYPLFCNVPLIFYDFPFLKLQNKGNIQCIQDKESEIFRF